MLADLFKPSWKSQSAEKRLKAVMAMDGLNADNQKILSQLATGDEASAVRIAAIQKLSPVASVYEISKKDMDDSVREAAEKRTDELLAAAQTLSSEEYAELYKRYPELGARIAAYADIDSVRSETINGLSTDQIVDALALTVFTDTRQQAAERLAAMVTDTEVLESALRMLRGKDKNAERILKDKIDEIKQQQRQHAENLASVDRLIEEVEYLVSHEWRPEFKAKLLVHRNAWDKLDFAVEPASLERYQAARKTIDLRFEELQLVEQARESQQQKLGEMNDIVNHIAAGTLTDLMPSLSETQTRLEQFKKDWQQLADKVTPEAVAQSRFDIMHGAMDSVIRLMLQAADILQPGDTSEQGEAGTADNKEDDRQLAETLTGNIQSLEKLLNALHWPAELGKLQVANELQAQLADWRKTLDKSAAEHKQQLDRLHKKISSIFRFSRSGNLAGAKQLCERVEKGLERFTGKERKSLEERFEEARKALGEMCDWKNFASEPKYIELCEAMESLVDSTEHPDKLSNEMKKLQQKWKAIGYSDVSEKYWPRFKEAADKVYQPCAEFFEKRHRTRQVNLEQRQKYVDQMRELLEQTDWDDNPDYKAVQNALRDVGNSFAAIKEVEYKDGQKQWKKFAKFRDLVKDKLAVVYDANIKLKHELVTQAEALAGAPAREENLARLKSLQIRWKQVGITRRKQDQKSWLEFKKHCDAVYDKVQELRQGLRAETDQQLDAYRDVIKEIQQLAGTAEDLAEADHQFSELQARYQALPALPTDLPEKLVNGINRDYRNACDRFDQCHLRIVNNKHQQQLAALRQKANLCALLEALGESPPDAQLQKIAEEWDAIELHDPVLLRRIEKRRESVQTNIDRKAIGDERRMLCIQLEIALDAESPAEDKARRMQYQLDQMNQSGLGQQVVDRTELVENMELDWLCMPGAEPELQRQLDERFQQVLRSV